MDKYLTIAVGPVGPARGTMPSRARTVWIPSETDILGQMGQAAPKGGSFAPQKARQGLPEARSPGCADTWQPEKGAARKSAAEANGTWTNISNTTHIVAFLTRFAQ